MTFTSRIGLRTAACDLLGCQYPVVLAGMGGVSRSELVAAVINAGGYGFLGMVRENPEFIRQEIKQVRQLSQHEFGVNLIPSATNPALLEQQIKVCLEENIPSVCLFWEVDTTLIRLLRTAGVLVAHQVGSLEDARKALDAGVHVLILQGVEAGGHVRGTISSTELLNQVATITEVPLLLAGGMTDGRDLAETLEAGADGIMAGTAFLATHESFANDFHKRQITGMRSDETILTRLFHINWPKGALTRVVPNSTTRGHSAHPGSEQQDQTETVIGDECGRPVYLYSTDSPLRSTTGDLEAMALYAGCSAYRINTIEPAAKRLESILAEASLLLGLAPGMPAIEGSSPPCFAASEESQSHKKSIHTEFGDLLGNLLAAEYAGARAALRFMIECNEPEIKPLYRSIYMDEARWCDMLTHWSGRMGFNTPQPIGSFYLNAMSSSDTRERLHFLNKGQAWVVREISKVLPDINNMELHEDMNDMLLGHLSNIRMLRGGLEHDAGM